MEMLLFEIEGPEPLYLGIKIVGDKMDVRAYFKPDGLEFGTRANLIAEQEHLWIFQEPEDVDNFNPYKDSHDLEFTDQIFQNNEKDAECIFDRKGGYSDGLLHGECIEDGETVFVSILEYSTGDEHENPEILIIELGSMEMGEFEEDEPTPRPEGGYVMLLQGCNISSMSDVSVIRI
jgi:hypothetical protein